MKDISPVLSDRLRELGNIGCSRALTALSQLTDTDFAIRVPEIEFVDIGSLPRLIGAPEDEMVCVSLDISGDFSGVFMLLLRPDIAGHILAAMGAPAPEGFRTLKPMSKSALMELGNIMCSSYMTAISEMTGLTFACSVPALAADMLGAILNAPISRFARDESDMLYIQNVFTVMGKDWVGSTLLLPEIASANTLSDSLSALL